MQLDIVRLFQDYGIEYWEEGKNCQQGFINIQCPLCADQSNHGGFSIATPDIYYNCWNCGWHSLFDIFKVLLPNTVYKEVLSDYRNLEILNNREPQLKTNFKRKTKIVVPGSKTPGIIHKKYLKTRNFNDIDYLISKYNLHFTDFTTNYKYRIIFPIYWKGKIISYQGRDVTNKQELRYKACSKDNELMDHKNVLYNIDNCKTSSVCIVEGVFDCIRFGDNFAAVLGISYTDMQIQILKRYKKIFILFDPDEPGQKRAEKISIKLTSFGIDTSIVVLDNKDIDPAKLSHNEAITLKKDLQLF